jgi:predicted transcriptional regulator
MAKAKDEKTDDGPMLTTSLRIPQALADEVRRIGNADDRSLNYTLVRAVREFVERNPPGNVSK